MRIGNNFNILALLFYFAVLMAATMTYSHPYFLSFLLAITVLGIFSSGRLRSVKNYLFFCLIAGAMTFALNLLLSHSGSSILYETQRMPLFGSVMITKETIHFSLNMALKLTTVILAFSLLSLTMDRDRTTRFIMRYLPKSSLIFILSSALFPRMKRSVSDIRETMKLRGAQMSGSLTSRLKANYPVLKILMLSSLEDSWSCAEALHARGFGTTVRTRPKREPITAGDILLMAGSTLALGGFIYSLIRGYGFHDFYSSVPFRNGFDASSVIMISGGLLIFPLINMMKKSNECNNR